MDIPTFLFVKGNIIRYVRYVVMPVTNITANTRSSTSFSLRFRYAFIRWFCAYGIRRITPRKISLPPPGELPPGELPPE